MQGRPRRPLDFAAFLSVDRSNAPTERVKYRLPPKTPFYHPENRPLPSVIRHSLQCHRATPCTAVSTIETSIRLIENGNLAVNYHLDCNPGDILLPGKQPTAAKDDLWLHTCCEAFIAAVDVQEYREFNFSPSSQWANYCFTDYRIRDKTFIAPSAPQIHTHRRDDCLEIDALIGREMLPHAAAWNIGLSVVIETLDGSKSYWALAHCAAQPDFHRRQSFLLTLNAIKP